MHNKTLEEWDGEMQRWRHPEYKEWVFYSPHVDQNSNRWMIKFFNERTGDYFIRPRRYNDEAIPTDEAMLMLEDYFAYNEEKLNWYKAKRGEVWELIVAEDIVPVLAISEREFLALDNAILYNIHDLSNKKGFHKRDDVEVEVFDFSDSNIVSGRPVWTYDDHQENTVANTNELSHTPAHAIESSEKVSEKNSSSKNEDNSYDLTEGIIEHEEEPAIYDQNKEFTFLK